MNKSALKKLIITILVLIASIFGYDLAVTEKGEPPLVEFEETDTPHTEVPEVE